MRLFDKKFYTNSGVGGTAASLSLINATLFYLKFAPPLAKNRLVTWHIAAAFQVFDFH